MLEHRKCRTCSKSLPLAMYYDHKGRESRKPCYGLDCKECELAKNNKWIIDHSDHVIAQRKKRYQENKERFHEYYKANQVRHTASVYRWREENRAVYLQIRKRRWLKTYGLTFESFDALLESQGGKCVICGTTEWGGRWNRPCIDHIHGAKPVIVRGLLCIRCNRGLGEFSDDAENLQRAFQYLKKGKQS